MQNLAEVLRGLKDHECLLEFDKLKIKKVLEEFDQALSRVSSPIVEKFEKVEKREVNVKDGNPSDKNYKEGQKSTFKMKVTSNRKSAP